MLAYKAPVCQKTSEVTLGSDCHSVRVGQNTSERERMGKSNS